MTLEKTELVQLSENEAKAIKLVRRICDGISRKAEDPNLIEVACNLTMWLDTLTELCKETV